MLGSVSEPERSRILFPACAGRAGGRARALRRLCLRRLRYFVLFDETNPKSRVMAYRLPHLGLTLFGGIGLIAGWCARCGSDCCRRSSPWR